MSSSHTIQECLDALGVSVDDLSHCGNVQSEYSVIKKAYYAKILVTHPDKGGDSDSFRLVQTSFEVLRRMYESAAVSSFASSLSANADAYDETFADFGDMPTPSWEYFQAAAEEEVPIYRVELARSGRSKCKARGKAKKCVDAAIAVEELRVGWMNEDTGSYGGWVHVGCWRVPKRVWQGLPDPNECTDRDKFEKALLGMNEVLLCGVNELSEEDKSTFVDFVVDKEHWARKTKPRKVSTLVDATSSVAARGATAVVPGQERRRFVTPVPGQNGAAPNALAGKTVVLTGTFPEVGGGRGLNLGKDKVKHMVEAFGGRVTGSISGRTDILLVGKDPGFSKVSKAREKPNVQLINLKDLKEALEGEGLLEDAPPAIITDFSSGYNNNSAALGASIEAVAIAMGKTEAPKPLKAKSVAAKPRSSSNKRKAKDDEDKKPAARKKPRKKTATKKNTTSKDDKKVDKTFFEVTCDRCGAVCSEESWFVKETEEDFCCVCHDKENTGGVLQNFGVNI